MSQEELLERANRLNDRLASESKTAGGKSLNDQLTATYEQFIQETGKVLPAALEKAAGSIGLKLAVVKGRNMGLKHQLSFDGYMLEGGRGEKRPDFIGRVIIEKKPSSQNFLSWHMAILWNGRSEVEESGTVDGQDDPSDLAFGLSYSFKKLAGTR